MSIVYQRFISRLKETNSILLTEFKTIASKVTISCCNDHIFEMTPKNFASGHNCPRCSNRSNDQARERFISLLSLEGYQLLSKYINNKTKTRILCNNGHELMMTPTKMMTRGDRCPICSGNNKETSKNKFLKMLEIDGYILLDEYINNKTKVLVKCNKGHEYFTTSNNFVYKYSRCPHCKGSTGQRKLQELLLEQLPHHRVIYNDRRTITNPETGCRLELDIYYPDLKFAIEYNGSYHHNLESVMLRDIVKKDLCKEKDIELLIVWDDEFIKYPIDMTNKVLEKINEHIHQ